LRNLCLFASLRRSRAMMETQHIPSGALETVRTAPKGRLPDYQSPGQEQNGSQIHCRLRREGCHRYSESQEVTTKGNTFDQSRQYFYPHYFHATIAIDRRNQTAPFSATEIGDKEKGRMDEAPILIFVPRLPLARAPPPRPSSVHIPHVSLRPSSRALKSPLLVWVTTVCPPNCPYLASPQRMIPISADPGTGLLKSGPLPAILPPRHKKRRRREVEVEGVPQ